MTPRHRALFVVGAATAMIACSPDASQPPTEVREHPSFRRVRVAISEQGGDRVAIYDVADRELVGVVAVAPAPLSASSSGAFAYSGGEMPRFLFAGVSVIDHDDHIHIYKSPPSLVADAGFVAGSSSVTSRAGYFGLVGRKTASDANSPLLVREQSLKAAQRDVRVVSADQGNTPSLAWVVPLSRDVVIGADVAKSTIVKLAPGAATTDVAPCISPGIVGASATRLVAACGREIVSIALDDDASSASVMARAQLDEEVRAIAVHRGNSLATVTLAANRFVTLDLATGRTTRTIDRPDACATELDTFSANIDEARLVTLERSGRLVWTKGGSENELQVGDPNACTADRTAAPPLLSLSPDHAFVVLRDQRALADVDLSRGRVRRVELPFIPSKAIVLGLDAKNLDTAEGKAHDGF